MKSLVILLFLFVLIIIKESVLTLEKIEKIPFT